MKLRVRFGGVTHALVTPEVCSLDGLRALVASRLGGDVSSVRLSLNNREELSASSSATLQAAGICPGDLLYVLGSPAPPADAAHARTVRDAAQAGGGGAEEKEEEMEEEDVREETLSSLYVPTAAVPEPLRALLARCSPLAPKSAPCDWLALALHAAMVDCGFHPLNPCVQPVGGRVRYLYSLDERDATPSAWLRCSVVGGELVAYAGAEGGEVHRLALALQAHSPPDTSLRTLWVSAKDLLASRAARSARTARGLPSLTVGLLALPEHVKALILALLDAPALAALLCTCTDLRFACAEDSLWCRLFSRNFDEAARGAAQLAPHRGWRGAFAVAWTERERARRRANMAADMRRRRPRPHIFPVNPFDPELPQPGYPGMPGVIGGDYDLYPGGMGLGRGGFGRGGEIGRASCRERV